VGDVEKKVGDIEKKVGDIEKKVGDVKIQNLNRIKKNTE